MDISGDSIQSLKPDLLAVVLDHVFTSHLDSRVGFKMSRCVKRRLLISKRSKTSSAVFIGTTLFAASSLLAPKFADDPL